MKNILQLDDAAAWFSSETGISMSSRALLRLAEQGGLRICFKYEGLLGAFRNDRSPSARELTVANIFACYYAIAEEVYWFNGYLRSMTPPRLEKRVTRHWVAEGKFNRRIETVDTLEPWWVEPAVTLGGIPEFRPSQGFGLARAKCGMGQDGQPLPYHHQLDRSPIPPGDWLFLIDDLQLCLRLHLENEREEIVREQRCRQSDAGRRGAQLAAETKRSNSNDARLSIIERYKSLMYAGHPAPIKQLEREFNGVAGRRTIQRYLKDANDNSEENM